MILVYLQFVLIDLIEFFILFIDMFLINLIIIVSILFYVYITYYKIIKEYVCGFFMYNFI